MCTFTSYKPPTSKEAIEAVYAVLALISREGMSVNSLSIGQCYFDAILTDKSIDLIDITSNSFILPDMYGNCKIMP